MSPSRWAPIEELIREFQGFLAPTVPQLTIKEGVNCTDYNPISRATSPALSKAIGDLGVYGVYLMFDDSESLRYIGVSERLVGRIRKQLRRYDFVPRWIDVVPFPQFHFLAHALEAFLIRKVSLTKGNALVNKRGSYADIAIDLLLED